MHGSSDISAHGDRKPANPDKFTERNTRSGRPPTPPPSFRRASNVRTTARKCGSGHRRHAVAGADFFLDERRAGSTGTRPHMACSRGGGRARATPTRGHPPRETRKKTKKERDCRAGGAPPTLDLPHGVRQPTLPAAGSFRVQISLTMMGGSPLGEFCKCAQQFAGANQRRSHVRTKQHWRER